MRNNELPENDEIILGYESSSNVSFNGRLETGILRSEWAEMSEYERDQVIENTLFDLVNIYVVNGGDE